MNKPLNIRAAREQFARVMADVHAVDGTLNVELRDEIGFLEFSERVVRPDLRRRFRSAAIELLDANLREHWSDRPEVVGSMTPARLQETLDWLEVNSSWEKALAELLRRSDA